MLGSFKLKFYPRKDGIAVVKGFQLCAIFTPCFLVSCLVIRLWLQPCVPCLLGFYFMTSCFSEKITFNESLVLN